MNENVYSKLKKSRIIGIIIFGLLVILFNIICYRVLAGLEEMSLVGIVIYLGLTIFFNYNFIKNIIFYIDPSKNPTVLKYGSIENLTNLVKEINKTIVYSDKRIIISNDYITSKKNYNNIIHLDNVINAYQFIRRTNGMITAREIIIVEKNGKENHYGGYVDDEEAIIDILNTLSKVRNDIKIGFIK